MTFSICGDYLNIGSTPEFPQGILIHKSTLSKLLEHIDDDKIPTIRYYVENGKLPPQAPVWKDLIVVCVEGDMYQPEWQVLSRNSSDVDRNPIAHIFSSQDDKWYVKLEHMNSMKVGPCATPQEAVDAAILFIADYWGLKINV